MNNAIKWRYKDRIVTKEKAVIHPNLRTFITLEVAAEWMVTHEKHSFAR